jgi:hypothetical protein
MAHPLWHPTASTAAFLHWDWCLRRSFCPPKTPMWQLSWPYVLWLGGPSSRSRGLCRPVTPVPGNSICSGCQFAHATGSPALCVIFLVLMQPPGQRTNLPPLVASPCNSSRCWAFTQSAGEPGRIGSQRVALAGTFPTAPLQTGLDIFTSSGFPTTESVLGHHIDWHGFSDDIACIRRGSCVAWL